jgi:hypothetical protein
LGAFGYCENLVSVNFSEGLERVGPNTFWHCENLVSIHLPESLEQIEGYAFRECESLATVHLPESLKQIGEEAFTYCENLLVIQWRIQSSALANAEKKELLRRIQESVNEDVMVVSADYKVLSIENDEVVIKEILYLPGDFHMWSSQEKERFYLRYAAKEAVLRQHHIEPGHAVPDEVNTSMRSQEVARLTNSIKKDSRNIHVFFSHRDYYKYNSSFRLQITPSEKETIMQFLFLAFNKFREHEKFNEKLSVVEACGLPLEICHMIIAILLGAFKVTLGITNDISQRPKITAEHLLAGWVATPKDISVAAVEGFGEGGGPASAP